MVTIEELEAKKQEMEAILASAGLGGNYAERFSGAWRKPFDEENDWKDLYYCNRCERHQHPMCCHFFSCRHCKKEFKSFSITRRYCSYRCVNDAYIARRKVWREYKREKKCLFCSKDFKAKRRDAKYCCSSHRVMACLRRKKKVLVLAPLTAKHSGQMTHKLTVNG